MSPPWTSTSISPSLILLRSFQHTSCQCSDASRCFWVWHSRSERGASQLLKCGKSQPESFSRKGKKTKLVRREKLVWCKEKKSVWREEKRVVEFLFDCVVLRVSVQRRLRLPRKNFLLRSPAFPVALLVEGAFTWLYTVVDVIICQLFFLHSRYESNDREAPGFHLRARCEFFAKKSSAHAKKKKNCAV